MQHPLTGILRDSRYFLKWKDNCPNKGNPLQSAPLFPLAIDRVLALLPRFARYLLLPLTLVWILTAQAAENKGNYTFYVVPQLPPVVMQQAWGPLLKRLSQETGYHFILDIPPSIPAFEALLLKGIPDFVFTNPYLVVAVHKRQNYIPLVRSDAMLLQGYLVVRKDSPVKSLQDLKGKPMAFPAPNSFAASLYMRSLLEKAGVTVQPRYVGAHSNVYRQVVYGEVAAGGGVNYSYDREPQEIRDQLKVLYKTPPASPHPVAAHSRVPQNARDIVAAALLRIAATTDGAELVAAAQLPKPIRADYQRDYQPMEQLGLDRFFVYGED